MAREESFFDDLARGLADGSLSRGKALRLMGAALVGGTLGSLGIREASADRPGCKRAGKNCTRDTQCCGTLVCVSGTCQTPTTTTTGTPTTTTTETPTTTTTETPTTTTTTMCLPNGGTCTAGGTPCCSGNCNSNGFCCESGRVGLSNGTCAMPCPAGVGCTGAGCGCFATPEGGFCGTLVRVAPCGGSLPPCPSGEFCDVGNNCVAAC